MKYNIKFNISSHYLYSINSILIQNIFENEKNEVKNCDECQSD